MAKYDYQGSTHHFKKRNESSGGAWLGALALGIGIIIVIGALA